MSTLPFLLSVADELDNIHSQSYMDDFGLGFHPHRQYYRTPTIQLSLPASTDWMQGRHARYRSYKFYDAGQHTLDEEQPEEAADTEPHAAAAAAAAAGVELAAVQLQPTHLPLKTEQHRLSTPQLAPSAPASSGSAATHTASLVKSQSHDVGVGGLGLNLKAGGDDDDENIDRTVRMYNLSKKCCKNYYRHALETGPNASGRIKCSNALHSESQPSSSSEESLQQMPSPIEFLTCFLVKKSSRASKCSASASSHSHSHGSGARAGDGDGGQQLKKT